MTILLSTLNARYTHASLGLRYLLANMGRLQTQTCLQEFVIGTHTNTIVEKMLSFQPSIIGLGVYIWNIEETTKIVSMLKAVAPEVTIILGGPEISHETELQAISQMADYVIKGWGEASFPELCALVLDDNKPAQKIHFGKQLDLADIVMPYSLYSDEDIAHRILYVEASRGCPFRCEFCLSSLDKTARPFDTNTFLQELEGLYVRGARNFKFVDRTFNLNMQRSLQILDFFLSKLTLAPHDPVFAHFEVVPDHLPQALKSRIQQFPTGTLQLEIGVQTFNPTIQELISRKQDNEKTELNIKWLVNHTHAHLHTDLIVGLPGEDIESFAKGFDRLVRMKPHEIQIGILKRLRGTPILQHAIDYGLIFDAFAPYTILATQCIDFTDMQKIVRFARYWDLIANSGRFVHTLTLILDEAPFARFMELSEWIYVQTGATHNIAFERLIKLVSKWLLLKHVDAHTLEMTITTDYAGRFYEKSPKDIKRGFISSEKIAGLQRQIRRQASE